MLVIACGADAENAALHKDRPDRTMTIEKGVSLLALRKERRGFSQDVALHRHSRQFRPQTSDLHLLGCQLTLAGDAAQLACPMRLDPVRKHPCKYFLKRRLMLLFPLWHSHN
jgi:hypothetical protein